MRSASLIAAAFCCCQPNPRPVPNVAAQLDGQARRVERLVERLEREQRIRQAEDEFLLARTPGQREAAKRALWTARRSP